MGQAVPQGTRAVQEMQECAGMGFYSHAIGCPGHPATATPGQCPGMMGPHPDNAGTSQRQSTALALGTQRRRGNGNKYLFFPKRGRAPHRAAGSEGLGGHGHRGTAALGMAAALSREPPRRGARSRCSPSQGHAVCAVRAARPSHHGPVGAQLSVVHLLVVHAVKEGVLRR